MSKPSTVWTAYEESALAHEREGFERIQAALGSDLVVRAWTNLTLFEPSGRMHEVDALVLTRFGLWLLELKHWQGKLVVDHGYIISQRRPHLRPTTERNPVLRTRTKAQVLAGLLKTAAEGQVLVHVAPVVVMTHPEVELGYQEGSHKLPLLTVDRLAEHLSQPASDHPKPQALPLTDAQLTKLELTLARLDFARGKTQTRQAFSFHLGELLEEGPDYQDFLGEHSTIAGRLSRVRLFLGKDQAATQKAEREFQLLEGITHDGILAPQNLEETPEGPALLYPFIHSAQPFDRWLAENDLLSLSLDDRVKLWRSLGETLRYAHHRKLLHRSLGPKNLLAMLEKGRLSGFKITNWYTGRGQELRGATQHLSDLIDESTEPYIAPELSVRPEVQTAALDLYSLGALGHLFLTGQAPTGDLQLSETIPQSLRSLLAHLLQDDPALRLGSAEAYLEALDGQQAPVMRPPAQDWEILRPLGEGGSSLVFLARHRTRGQLGALKVAKAQQYDEVIENEGIILSRIQGPGVIALIERLEVDGRQAMVTELAGETDLDRYLRANGPFQGEPLRRLGSSLFDLADFLEKEKLYYCDWKPANLGFVPETQQVRLYDFSLAGERIPSNRIGTPAYRDPHLKQRQQWDWTAERFALATTLYELTFGALPDSVLPEGHPLLPFFQQALAPLPEQRQATLREMRVEWDRLLEDRAAFEVEIDHSKVVGLAMQHNAIPVVHSWKVRYTGRLQLREVRLRLRIGDDFSEVAEFVKEVWEHNETWQRSAPHIILKAQQLVTTTETTRSYLALEIWVGGKQVHQHHAPLDVLAYNHWAGSLHLSELLCSFVLPNHPAVQQVLRSAEGLALSGYQEGSDHAYHIVARIYEAVSSLRLQYLEGSFGFLEKGQKIRTPDQILTHRQGNCLDVTCLVAACLHLAGLHPVLVLVQGHAFPGCWLRAEDDPNGHITDAATLQKAIDLGLLCLFDSSSLCVPPARTFDQAQSVARGYLDDEDKFEIALDMRSAERSSIRPLPLRFVSGENQMTVVLDETARPASPESPLLSPRGWTAPQSKGRKPREAWEKRLDSWKNRLLDLSTRNRLLDIKRDSNRRILPLLLEEPQKLLAALLAGQEYVLMGRPGLLRAEDPRDRQIAQKQTQADPVQQEVLQQFEAGRLCINLDDADLQKRSVELYRGEKISLEETGSCNLYLALGVLHWVESDKANLKRQAPIALLPVQLVRTRVNEPYKLRARDEELRVNLTLLRKVATDFKLDLSHLEQWPDNQDAPDLLGLLQTLRSELLNMKGWNIYNHAVIGSFSFAKLLMLQDLERFPELQDHSPVLRSFLEQNYTNTRPLLGPSDVESRPPEKSYCVLDADSSQLAAVYSSESGQSFVLQGPPGTGKSQTIANMITQNLVQGRSVLFVAEKMAALDVVHRRLQSVGLGHFCLELHSNKASKSEIIRQLGESLNQRRLKEPEQRKESAQQLSEQQKSLSTYVDIIHRHHPIGHSLVSAVARLAELDGLEVPLKVDITIAKDAWDERKRAGRELRLRLRDVGLPQQSCWSPCQVAQWGSESTSQLTERWTDSSCVDQWLAVLEEGEQIWGTASLEPLHHVFALLTESPFPTVNLVSATPWQECQNVVGRVVENLRTRRNLWTELNASFQAGLLTLDLERLRSSYQRWMANFFIGWLMLWSTKRRLRKVARKSLAQGAQILKQLDQAIQIRSLDETLLGQAERMTQWFGGRWRGVETSPDDLESVLAWTVAFRERLLEVGEALPQMEAVLSRARLLASDEDRLRTQGTLQQWLARYGQAYLKVSAWKRDWMDLLKIPENTLPADWKQVLDWIEVRKPKISELSDWALFVDACHVAEKLELQPLVKSIWSGKIGEEQVEQSLERSLLKSWFAHHAEQAPLNRFRGAHHSELVEEFRRLDAGLLKLNQRAAAAILAERVPVATGDDRGELAIVQREMKKQRAHKAPRQLFKEIPNLLPRIKPCLMMSPLSIAQYLDPGNNPYDLVIFDEASQISPWDALGALARGKQWIVVGDSKQLPPTSFFASAQEDDELDLELGGQLESILDECQVSGLAETSLTWHYRSSDERLIAFSNCYYYDNRLFTFPNAHLQHPRRGVHWRHVGHAVYGRGTTRQNPKEAQMVVDHLVERLLDPHTQQTFGVVTFNQAQQTLIENLLDQARAQHPEIERHFSNTLEPVFVKNLENVQGDERDVILFSIGYGPDESGKCRMEFGPLGKQGGERRLNVAVSRARQQMWVFSSLLPEQIDLSRTNARGSRDLRAFLDYARRGVEALPRPEAQSSEEQSTGLHLSVRKALVEKGWTVHSQIGCSGYQIDLAVVDPREPERYLAGVECDGESYCSAASTRDRDRLRTSVLGQLGWKMLRVWSMDWWRNPTQVVDQLQLALEQLVKEEPPAPSIEVEVEVETEVESVEEPRPWAEFEAPADALPAYFEAYLAETPVVPHEVSSLALLGKLRLLLSTEGPVTREYAMQRCVRSMGAKKVGARIRAHLEKLIEGLHRQNSIYMDGELLWLTVEQKTAFEGFRIHGTDCPREFKDVPYIELDNAILHELRRAFSLGEKVLFQIVARHFGKLKVGRDIAETLQGRLRQMRSDGKLKFKNDIWSTWE